MAAGVLMGVSELAFCVAVLSVAKYHLDLGLDSLRTLAFLVIVFGNQATTYTNRGRRGLGSARPSPWLVGSSAADIVIASTLAACGVAMAPLPLAVIGSVLGAAVAFAAILNLAKVPVFRRLGIG